MTATDRMQKILLADSERLAKIDAILCGKATDDGRKEETRLIYVSETAKMLGLSRPTVYKLIREGRLDAIELDGVHRIRLRASSTSPRASARVQPTQKPFDYDANFH